MADPAAGSPVKYGWDTDKVPSALSGFRLEGYTVEGELGRGGMGQVYRAREQASGREVAIKVLPALALTERSRERFEREAELLARLRHSNVVAAHAWGRTDQAYYLITELVRGQHLDEAARALPVPARLALLEQVARALAAIHAEGIVHRDLKPANLLVDEAGVVKLIDFGVSTADDVDRLTRTGQFVGTPLYAPPERFASSRTGQGPTDDVWALGAIGFELLTGQRPYPRASGNLYEHIVRLQDRAPLASSLNPDVGPALAAVLARALEPEPDDRFPHALAFFEALRQAQRPAPEREPVLWRGVVLVLAVVGAAFLLALSQRPASSGDPPGFGAPTHPAGRALSQAEQEALAACLARLPGGVNDAEIRVALSQLRGALSAADPQATELADRVVAALTDPGTDWQGWGQHVLVELARSGARPSQRLLAESLCEELWWATQRVGEDRLDLETARSCLVALVRLDVDIDGMQGAFTWDQVGPRAAPADAPELKYLKLRAQVRRRRAPDHDPDRVALLELVLAERSPLGPTTRARGICEGARSERDPDRRLALVEEARRLDPGSLHADLEHARSLLWAGRLTQGRAELASSWEVWLQVHGARFASAYEVVAEAEGCVRALLLHGDTEGAERLVRELASRYEKLPEGYREIVQRVERCQPGGEEIRDEDKVWIREGLSRRW